MMGAGVGCLAIGALLFIVGAALIIPFRGMAVGIGWALVALGCAPALAGAALVASSVVSRRSRAGKPFA